MRYSQTLIPTVKEVPAEAEIVSHRLMIRAGFIRKLASGTYTYMPLGYKSLLKIMAIIRQEMNAAGAQEVSMPILQPMELWVQTGRNKVFADIMCSFQDRHGRQNVLAPTAEEVVTSLVAGEVSSYKQLPLNLYQINTKFRDEFRPRFGVLRSREFIMKDAYSFDATVEGLNESYRKMYDAYCRIFTRCGLKYVTVEAESGGMGGTDTEEFMIVCDAGEDILISSDKGNYAANVERAATGDRPSDLSGPPTGELTLVETPGQATIEAVSKFMKVKPGNLLKTLIFLLTTGGKKMLAIGVVRGDHELNESKFKGAVFAHPSVGPDAEIAMIEANDAAEMNIPIGFVGPHIIARPEGPEMLMFVDPDAARAQFWAAGANKKDTHVKHFNWKRDVLDGLGDRASQVVAVADIRNARAGDPSPRNDGGLLQESRGIEVGHVFKLGTKYATQLGAMFLDESGQQHPCIMGCYGIGVNRILASAVETGHDDNGCILPISIAPFEVEVLAINRDSQAVMAEAERIYRGLADCGVDVLFDDRDARPGVKFKDADLLGIPIQVVVGDRALAERNVEVKRRTDEKATAVPNTQVIEKVLDIISEMKAALKTN